MRTISVLIAVLLVNALAVKGRGQPQTDTSKLHAHLASITRSGQARTYDNPDELNRVANYIRSVFETYSDSVHVQAFEVNGTVYKNVICSFGTGNSRRIVIGAHYDVCGKQEGADDNGSGVAGLLELSRLLSGQALTCRIDLVAYSLEEPPFFRTESMGSFVHAQSLIREKADVLGMISLEMIGYFKDGKHSQSYPLKPLSLFYGNRGNYITLVGKFGAGKFSRKFTHKFRSVATVPTRKFKAPGFVPGIDFSDHLNYWNAGISALMITDTSFFRNPHYHKPSDTMETLDLPRMARVIDGVFRAIATSYTIQSP